MIQILTHPTVHIFLSQQGLHDISAVINYVKYVLKSLLCRLCEGGSGGGGDKPLRVSKNISCFTWLTSSPRTTCFKGSEDYIGLNIYLTTK